MDVKDFLEEMIKKQQEKQKEKCRQLGLPEDAPKYLIRQEEIKRALIEKYNLDLQSAWKEIWNYMSGLKELDTAKEASEKWEKLLIDKRATKELPPFSEEQLLIFKCILASMIDHELQKQEQTNEAEVDLRVYYSPCGVLGNAAEISNIYNSSFPFNRGMTVTKESVTAYEIEENEFFKESSQEAHNDGEVDDGSR